MDTVRSSASVSYSLPRLVSVDSLRATTGRSCHPLVIDVRHQQAFDADTHLIASATWRDPYQVADWTKYLPRHQPVVV